MKHIITATAIALAVASPASALCSDGSLVVHFASYHTDRDLIRDVNETNPGLGCRVENFAGTNNLDWEFGGYINSFGLPTGYHVFDLTNDHGFGLYAGIASGYYGQPTKILGGVGGLAAIAGVVYQGDTFTVRATPSYSERTGDIGVVMGFSFALESF